MENQFTVTDLIKHMARNAWWIIILGIVVGAGMYVMNKQPAAVSYSADRSMYVAKSNTNVKDPNSRIMADSWLLNTYKGVANDPKIIKPTVKALKKEDVKVTATEVRQNISMTVPDATLYLKVSASGLTNGSQAVKMVNAYTQSFAENAPKLISDMPKPELLSKATHASTDTMVGGSPKKAAMFGLVAGIVLGIVLAFFTGIYKNMTAAKR